MFSHRLAMALLAVVLGAGATLALAAQEEWTQPTKKWIKGPVKWIMTDAEKKDFKKLKTDEEREVFIKEFWSRRDPTPETPRNEFAEHFWARVEAAETRFPQVTDSGALSDRGFVFILFGGPQSEESGKNLEWNYEEAAHMSPSSFQILFRQNMLLGKKDVDELIAGNQFVIGLGSKVAEVYAPPPAVAEGLPSADESQVQEEVQSEEAKLLDTIVESGSLPSDIPIQVQTDFYVATHGDSFASITLGVPNQQVPNSNLTGFARFIPKSPEDRPITLAAAESFLPAEKENSNSGGGLLLYQGGAGLHPGNYTLYAGMRDPASDKVGVVKRPIEVPSYVGGGLSLSTVILAQTLAPLSSPPIITAGKKPAFVLGSFRVVPSLDGVFRQGSQVAVYFQIYNATPDSTTGRMDLTIEYDFQLKQEGEFRPVADPVIQRNRTSQVEAFSFPLVKPTATQSGWVEGEYKLGVQVTDEVAKSTVSKELFFKVIP